ncbi:MAG: signal recognition particle-docking protein FtsY [Thermoproteales archaeon]|nr:signal recognition particle-docking protein FtsY [Thermoproteales archaeon]
MFEKLKATLSKLVETLSTRKLSEKELDSLCFEVILSLSDCDVALAAAEYIADELKKRLSGERIGLFEDKRQLVKKYLKEILLQMLQTECEIDLLKIAEERKKERHPLVILFVGPNGHGKTTTIAKIARLFLKKGFSVVIAAADTFRAGAIEQLETHGKKLGVRVIKHCYGADPAAVAYDAVQHAKSKGINVVLIDTAGRLQTDKDLMDEMRKIARVVSPDLKIFVGDALTGNDALDQALKFDQAIGIDASILTKADADIKGGAAISVIYATRKPILFLGTGQTYDDLQKFSADWLLQKILEK